MVEDIVQHGDFMKQWVSVIFFPIVCSFAVYGCSGKNLTVNPAEPVVFYDLPEIHVLREADPSSEASLSVTIGFVEQLSLRREIELKEPELKKIISRFGSRIGREDLTDVERYEKLRSQLKEQLNGELFRGGIVKVLFRKIDIK